MESEVELEESDVYYWSSSYRSQNFKIRSIEKMLAGAEHIWYVLKYNSLPGVHFSLVERLNENNLNSAFFTIRNY